MIELSLLEFSYGDSGAGAFAIHIEALRIPQGETTALVGPSGSGKTTLLNLIAGTLRADTGDIRVANQDIGEITASKLGDFRIRHIGQVFQSFELLHYLTVVENVMLPWFIHRQGTRAAARDRALEILNQVGLAEKSAVRPGELSQGEQQRVAVCRAMLNNPPLLMADEPTGNLDQQNKQNVVDLLCNQARRNDSTLLMVTHDESLLGSFDRVLHMKDLASGSATSA